MNCFSCFTSQKSKKNLNGEEVESASPENVSKTPTGDEGNQEPKTIKAQTFTFRELAVATKNFRQECLMGEGGFGRVYKGTISASGKVVAVKQLDRTGMHGSKDFLSEVAVLSHLNHENLVNLVGYCADGDQRLLVYEYMPGGSVDSRLFEFDKGKPPMDWFTRIKIALGAAKGVEYLHDKANPPIVYRDLKSSNILLDGDGNPRLSDFGLAKLSGGDKSSLITPGVTGTYGYSAPEYARTGHLTLKSDVYGFGVVLLELISGRRAIDTTRPNEEQNLISWAQPMFRNPKRFPEMADPLLKNNFPEKDLNQAVAVAAMCLQEEEGARPLMSDVVMTLSFLSMIPPEVIPASQSPATMPPAAESVSSDDGSEEEEEDISDDESYTDSEDDEEQEELDNEGGSKEFYAKSRGKSSKKKSKKHDKGSSSEEGSCSGSGSQKKSKKWRVLSHKSSKKGSKKETKQKSSKRNSLKILSQNSSKKNSEKELNQKSSKKSPEKGLSPKSSKKSSEKELSQKSSKKRIANRKASRGSRSEDETSRTTSQGDVSIGMRSSGELSDHNDDKKSKEAKHHLPHAFTTKHPPKDQKRDLLSATSAKI